MDVFDTFAILSLLRSKLWLGVPSFFIRTHDLVIMASVPWASSRLIVTTTSGKATLTFAFDCWGN